jgi:hypothetical protein
VQPTEDLVVKIDQRSEMGGPARVPELDGAPSPAGSRTFVPTSNPPFPPSAICVRILPNGDAWLALVNLASVAPGLPAGDYPIDAFGTPITARRGQPKEGSLVFGEGVIAGELLADASLGLDVFS